MLWGDALRRAVQWKWRSLVSGDDQWLAIASPDGAHAVAVESMVARQLQKRDTTIVLLFNMIVGGKLPEARAGQVVPLS